jgi:Carboxypeptidase regulatory-like domain/TonB-dependent Receptor Plug Domain
MPAFIVAAPAGRYRTLAAALLIILGISLISPSTSYGQSTTTGDVAGIVQDPSNAAVPGATVALKDNDTGVSRTATTNGQGEYHFTLLRPGSYTISAVSAGLQSDLIQITVSVGQTANAMLATKLQATQQTVEISGAAALIDVQSPNLDETISQHDIENLPLPGGDLTAVVFSAPGVAVSTGSGFGNFSVHGLPGNSNLFTINGNDYNDAYTNVSYSGASNLLLGSNEVQEATIVLNPYSVQYGRQAGAQIDYVTKSGTNQFHGNLLWNWNGDALNANTFFNNANGVPTPRAVSNQYGAAIGGPVKKNKLFFFANTEGIRYALPAAGYVTIPSPQLEAFTLNNISPSQTALYQKAFQYWNSAPGAAGAVPVTNGNGLLQDSSGTLGCGDLAGTPAPNGGVFGTNVSCASAYGANGSNLNTEWLMMTRVDYNINDSQRIYFRYKGDHGLQPTATSLINPIFNIQSRQPAEEGQISHNWTISPNMVNNLVASFSWYSEFFNDQPAGVAALPVNFFIYTGGSNGAAGFTQAGVGANGEGFNAFPQGRNEGQGQITDDFSLIHGQHSLRFGINYRRDRITDASLQANTNGVYNFTSLTSFATGQLMNGSEYMQAFPIVDAAHIRYYSAGIYAQDEWNVRANLKITAGIRFEKNANPTCADDCFARLDAPFSSSAFAKGIDIPYSQSVQTGLANAYPHTQFGVFEPRAGVVWSPKGSTGTVVRAGFGLFSDLSAAYLSSLIFNNAPNNFGAPIFGGDVNTAGDPNSAAAIALNGARAFRTGFAQGYTFSQLNAALASIGGFSPPTYFSAPKNVLAPKYLEWSFEIQQPLGNKNVLDVTYTGNHGRDLLTLDPTVNAYGFGGLPATVPDPRFGPVSELSNGGVSNYDGLTIAVRRSLAYGFKGEIGYTWSHSLDDLSSPVGAFYNYTNNNVSQTTLNTPYGPKANYSNSDYDMRNYVTADFLWDVPFKPRNAILRDLIGDWTAGSRYTLHSGVPFSVYDSNEAFGLYGQNVALGYPYNAFLATALPGTNTNCSAAAVNTPCFTPANFVSSGNETNFGNLPRNSFRAPGFFDWDATLYKAFPIREKYRFTVGASAYNLTNHANFDAPSGNIAAPGLGLINATVSEPTSAYGGFQRSAVSARIVVLTARFQF